MIERQKVVGSLTDPKVRRALRDAGPPECARLLLELQRDSIEHTDHLYDALAFWRWSLAEKLPRSKPLTIEDFELTIAFVVPLLTVILDALDAADDA